MSSLFSLLFPAPFFKIMITDFMVHFFEVLLRWDIDKGIFFVTLLSL